MRENVCRSGGSAGADILFGEFASQLGHKVVHYTFAGFEAQAKADGFVVLRKLTPFQLREADPYLNQANKSLRQEFPTGIEYRDNVLRKSWWITRSVETVYAVCRLDLKNQQVAGADAWPIQCILDRAQEQRSKLRAYVFDQTRSKWYRFDPVRRVWISLPPHRVPLPRGEYAGIGAVKLSATAARAIGQLFRLVKLSDES